MVVFQEFLSIGRSKRRSNGDKGPIKSSGPSCACKNCPHLGATLFSSLTAHELQELTQHKVVNTYLAGQAVFYQDNFPLGVYCIDSGRVKIYKSSENGSRQIVRIGVAGELLGYRALLAQEPYRATAEALEKTRICFIEKGIFLSLLATHPPMALRLAQKACVDLGKAEEHESDLASKSVEARLSKLLIHLNETCGVPCGGGRSRIQLQFSRADLADWIGATPETVIRLLAHFRKRGLISIQNRELTIHDAKTLSAISHSNR